ncbi:MAG TPA: trypsin-like peptidase domain-containing protein [Nocardioides sp.]
MTEPDADDTRPLGAYPPPGDTAPSWSAEADGPKHAAPGGFPLLPPAPSGGTHSRVRRGAVPGWLIPTVVLLALVVGAAGGAIGGAAFQASRSDDDRGGSAGSALGEAAGRGVETTAPLDEDNTSVEAVASQLLPSTVQVFALAEGGDDATGSGFVFDAAGHIITNNHVIESAVDGGTVEVQATDGRKFEVEVVGRSPVYDIAVLRADDARELTPVAFGSADELAVGEGVVAIGSPLGLAATVTAGIVSAKNRPVTTGNADDGASYINAVQTDAAINPGNSGGPLVNLAGQVVGVNSAIATTGGMSGSGGSIGVGFAIPSEQVLRTAGQIIEDGEATYPVIGAQVQVGGEGAGEGAIVDEVNDGSPAADAGLVEGDLVTAVNDQLVTGGAELIVALRSYAPGESVELTVLRDGDERRVDVVLGEQTG